MQQRLNNRWLSDELIEAVRLSTEQHPAPIPDLLESDVDARWDLHSTKQGHRRMWQHIATLLLLMGSAAFSYLAWSQGEPPQAPGKTHASSIATATAIAPAHGLAAERTNVNALRVANRELQLRIAALQEAITETAP